MSIRLIDGVFLHYGYADLSFDPVFMDDAKCAETNEKSSFQFLFSSYREKFIENWPYFEYKNDHNSKNKNRKNLKFDFSFVSFILLKNLFFLLLADTLGKEGVPHVNCKYNQP